MLHKTKGIVLHSIKYKESSIIVKIYTEIFGIKTYIVNGVRSKSSKSKAALYLPLTILDMIVYNKPSSGINRISEAKCFYSYQQVQRDFKKITIGLFVAEILNKTLKEEEANENLFTFLANELVYLDRTDFQVENFHIKFLIELSAFLGFYPSEVSNISAGEYKQLSNEEHQFIQSLIDGNTTESIRLNRESRNDILNIMIRFYERNLDGFGNIKSIEVLRELFN